MKEFLSSFLHMLRSERNASSNTLYNYELDLISFFKFITKINEKEKILVLNDVSIITEDGIKDYLNHLYNKKLKETSQARKLSSIKEFCRFLYSEKIRKDDPSLNIEAPKLPKSLPKYLTEHEISLILKNIDIVLPFDKALMIRLMIEILYSSGLRISELVSLKTNNIDKDKKLIVIENGKGGKFRVVPFNNAVLEIFNEYIKIRDIFVTSIRDNNWLFPSKSKIGHITRDGFFKILKKIASKAGISTKRVSPHVLRHSFASHLLKHHADLRSIQIMLGHSDIRTTEKYTHIMDEALIKVMKKSHPLNNASLKKFKK
ncbi:MAG: Tyrosine recombinase XerD [Alphaproteobacteria bacterium ADurb.Bin438]|nr:MAG: Tyrosine recombinase XerD [Alphaproteobacteria bacterium ADurb.Bin438]